MHFEVIAQNGAIGGPWPDNRHVGAGWVVSGCTLSLNHGCGVHLAGNASLATGAVVRDSQIINNGQLGMNMGSMSLIERCTIAGNNFAGFSQEWEAGGAKVAGVTNVTFRHCKVYSNNGTGLWSDICSTGVHYLDNLLLNVRGHLHPSPSFSSRMADSPLTRGGASQNSGPGVSHEISSNSTIRGNVACYNGWGKAVWLWGSQLQIQNSAGVLVYNNTVVAGHNNGLVVVQQNRTQCAAKVDLPFHAARDNAFYDNRVYYTTSWGESGGVTDFHPPDPTLELFSKEANNTFYRNTYFINDEPGGGLHWRWADGSESFTQWTTAANRSVKRAGWAVGSRLVTAPVSPSSLVDLCSLDQDWPPLAPTGGATRMKTDDMDSHQLPQAGETTTMKLVLQQALVSLLVCVGVVSCMDALAAHAAAHNTKNEAQEEWNSECSSGLPPAGPLCWINVKVHGARGDGTVDDTAAIAAAITAAATPASPSLGDFACGNAVVFPPGIYMISRSLGLPNRVALQGANGRGVTIRVVASGFVGTCMFHASDGTKSMVKHTSHRN